MGKVEHGEEPAKIKVAGMGGKNWKKGKPERDVIHTEIKGGMDKRTENRGGMLHRGLILRIVKDLHVHPVF